MDILIEIYGFVDDFLKQNPKIADWRQSNNDQPQFSDAEILNIAPMLSAFGVESLRKTFTLIAGNFRSEFPQLCGYKQFIRRLHRLTGIIQQIFKQTSSFYTSDVYLMDAKPIPLCQTVRHRRSRLLREGGAYFGKTTKGWFFGFKLHVVATAGKRANLPSNLIKIKNFTF